jgi:hypothetical protein
VAGGDGSVSQVLQGMDISRQALAVIPAGTGNSLAREYLHEDAFAKEVPTTRVVQAYVNRVGARVAVLPLVR